MKIRAFSLIGFVLAALIGLAGASACPHSISHAETTARAKGAVVMLDAHERTGGEPQCHHNRASKHHALDAWMRPAQNLIAPASVKQKIPSVAALPPRQTDPLAGKERPCREGLPHGSHACFAAILARNSRLLI